MSKIGFINNFQMTISNVQKIDLKELRIPVLILIELTPIT